MSCITQLCGKWLHPPGGDPRRRRSGACRLRRKRLAVLLSSTVASAIGVATLCALLLPGLAPGVSAAEPAAAAATAVSATAATPVTSAVPQGQGPGPTALSKGSTLVLLPWGSGPGQVGLLRPTEGLAQGPQSLAIAPDGRIAILDSVNHRILELDGKGTVTGSVAVPLTEPRFLAVTSDRLFVLDCATDRRLLVLDWAGQAVDSISVPAFDDPVSSLFATDRGPYLELAHQRVYLVQRGAGTVASPKAAGPGVATLGVSSRVGDPAPQLHEIQGRPLGRDLNSLVSASFQRGKSPQLKFSTTPKGSLDASPAGQTQSSLPGGFDVDCLVSVDSDGRGGMIVGAGLLAHAGQAKQPALLVTHLQPVSGATTTTGSAASNGAATTGSALATARPVSYILLADSTYAYVGQPYTVGPDGRVYQPMATEAGYSILVHSFPAATLGGATEQGGSRWSVGKGLVPCWRSWSARVSRS